jgi:HAD superfamily hydrolase (TIGR01490 family)
MEKVIAVFDLEGTLFKRNSDFMYEIRSNQGRGVKNKIGIALFDIILIIIFILYRLHLISEQAMRTATIKRFAAVLKNSSEKKITQKANVFAANYMKHLRPEMSRIIEEHKKNGHITILLSGSLQPYIEAIKRELGMDIAKGTQIEMKKSIYTGQLSEKPYFGESRAQALREIINELCDKVALGKSFAYGDAIFDRYFMGMVGNPVAVYPDKKLAEHAQGHGWKVIDNTYIGE